MLAATQTEQFRRSLAPVVAVVLALGLAAAVLDGPRAAYRLGRAPVEEHSDGTVSGSGGIDGSDGRSGAEGESPSATPVPAPLGPAMVPAPGVYRYDVDAVSDGVASSRIEEREIAVVGEEGASSIVQVVARSDGERQVSVLDWSSESVLVRSTRIESDEGGSQDCTWDPPFVEFGTLAAGAAWDLESTCTTDVAGLATTFVITGSGRVIREAEVVHAGASVRVWQVVRDRTTTIMATVGEDQVEQVIRETGTFFIDPARGLVLRSDLTATLSGTQQGVTRRTSVLTEA